MVRVAARAKPAQRGAMDALPLVLDWLRPRLTNLPLIVGICGSQGSGKSTLAANLAAAVSNSVNREPTVSRLLPLVSRPLPKSGLVLATVSLDDFYLSRARRQALARHTHPLLATRGPPGTHDLPLLVDVLLRVRAGRPVALPVFDKLADDRLAPQHWRRHDRIDVLVLEGWCVGARPQPAAALLVPVNALEADEDPHGHWRRHINRSLAGPYQRVWAMLDALVFLAAPDWETVPRWRAEQEAGLVRASGRSGMDTAALARFCAHYERLTRWQLADTPRHAGLTLRLDGERRVIRRR